MPKIPRDSLPEATLAFAADPYHFISRRCSRYNADLFETRLLLRKTICMMGQDAARLFYDASRFKRQGAPPGRIQRTLLGRGGVQSLDDAAHRHRKQMFMAITTPARVDDLKAVTQDRLEQYLMRWTRMPQFELFRQLQEVLTESVCEWAGVPLEPSERDRRTDDLTALFNSAGGVGPQYWRARLARKRSNHWVEQIIEEVRAGRLKPESDQAAHLVAWHHDLEGQLLPPRIAAVELLNVLRPTVAVSVYILFAILALHDRRDVRRRVADESDGQYMNWFVQEVRRYYPFFPAMGAIVRENFAWKGYRCPAWRRVILDLYGTNHDPRLWEDPGRFRPERFRDGRLSPYDFVPQGGGDAAEGHRCPGERVTVELTKLAVRFFTGSMSYTLPEQNLEVNDRRLPALPASRIVMAGVESRSQAAPGGMRAA